jgi:hypothetical protein
MKLYYSNSSDTESSFFFDNSNEQTNFIQWLESLNISYLKTKYPAPNDKGEIIFKTSIVVITPKKDDINNEEDEEDIEEDNSEIEETVEVEAEAEAEVEVEVEAEVEQQIDNEVNEEGKKKRKKSNK